MTEVLKVAKRHLYNVVGRCNGGGGALARQIVAYAKQEHFEQLDTLP